MSPPSICEALHCRGSWLLVAGPDKSLWSLMFVSDTDWVHNCLKARGHDIHLPAIGSSNTVRVIASATHPEHAAETHFTKLTCPSFLSFCYCTASLGNYFNVQSSILTKSAESQADKCFLVCTAPASKNPVDYFKGHTAKYACTQCCSFAIPRHTQTVVTHAMTMLGRQLPLSHLEKISINWSKLQIQFKSEKGNSL